MKKIRSACAVFLALTIAAGPAGAQTAALGRIGVAGAVSGKVLAFSPSPKPVGRIVESGKPLYLKEKVTTGPKGRLQIMFEDETIIALGPNSTMVLDEFVYDPGTNTGTVSAQVVRGVFRFFTGRIGHKHPSSMSVRLPTGVMSVRGTMVAGIVSPSGAATAVLLGPGPAHNSPGERIGAFSLQNAAGSVDVTRPGFGSTLGGEGLPPTPAVLIPQAVLNEITNNLEPAPAAAPSAEEQASGVSAPAEASPTGSYGSDDSATEASGQDTAEAAGDLSDTSSTADLAQELDNEAQTAQQDYFDAFSLLADLSTWDEIRAVQTGTGFYSGAGTYFCSGGECGAAGGAGPMNFSVQIDFGKQTIGGGASLVQVVAAAGGLTLSDSTSLNQVSFAGLAGPAVHLLNSIQGNHTNGAFDGTSILLIGVGGVPGEAAVVDLNYKAASGAAASGAMAGLLTRTGP